MWSRSARPAAVVQANDVFNVDKPRSIKVERTNFGFAASARGLTRRYHPRRRRSMLDTRASVQCETLFHQLFAQSHNSAEVARICTAAAEAENGGSCGRCCRRGARVCRGGHRYRHQSIMMLPDHQCLAKPCRKWCLVGQCLAPDRPIFPGVDGQLDVFLLNTRRLYRCFAPLQLMLP